MVLGLSGQYEPCRKSEEQHIKRHRAIAELIHQLEVKQDPLAMVKTKAKKRHPKYDSPSPTTKKKRKEANKTAR